MGEYFGFEIQEREDGVDVADLLESVDPKYHKAVVIGLHFLSEWYGDKAYRQLDDWFTAVYATVMEMEELLNKERARNHSSLSPDFIENITVKE